MQKRLIIPLEDFSTEEPSRYIEGDLDPALFELDNEDVQPVGPLHYELNVQLFENELLVQGYISTRFRFTCVRCLEQFEHEIEIEKFTLSEDVSTKLELDLTEALREELILELPEYPKCELNDSECEFLTENSTFDDFRLDKDPQTGVNSATPNSNSVWDALDQYPKD